MRVRRQKSEVRGQKEEDSNVLRLVCCPPTRTGYNHGRRTTRPVNQSHAAMNFELVFQRVIKPFEEEGLEYGLIGGFALGVMGILRSTIDMDFLLLVDDLAKAHEILAKAMYRRVYASENVSQYSSTIRELGHIDIIHAFRQLSREMLTRKTRFKVFDTYMVSVLLPEDIIGLKMQAIANDPSREPFDVKDMRLLLKYKTRKRQSIDWELLTDYFSLFGRQDVLHKSSRRSLHEALGTGQTGSTRVFP